MKWAKILFFILMAFIVVAAFIFYSKVFVYLIGAVIFSYILDPAVTWLEHRRIPRWLSVLFVYLTVAGLIAWFTSRMIPDIVAQANNLIAILSQEGGINKDILLQVPFLHGIHEYTLSLDARIPGLNISNEFTNILDNATGFLAKLPKVLLDNYSTIIGAVSFLGMIPLISFFLLKDKHKLRKAALKLSSNRYFELAIIILGKIDSTVGTYLRAMIFEVVAVSIMASIALSIVGVSNPILIGVTAGLTNIIPYFGPFVAGGLAVLTVLFEGGPLTAIVYAGIAMWAVQVVDNNIVYPLVVGTTINMHPLLVLLTVLAGGWYGGILWMLISVPLAFLTYSLVSVLYTNLKEYKII
ncbi:MAG: AI-2E family transporter [Candidatus Cloacimonetes bacterium]|jgi:predicted PurR-regulated permease PerM|nr:AI-2E family transporter [Candidatus Cloacimonadota bacterium]MDY0173183.1 AI-2E family transporter [Candidatus Cloacimonadaceae bacterium]